MLKGPKVIFLCIPLFFLFFDARFLFTKSIYGVCSKVLDGDTIMVNNQKIRLAYIDAPELDQVSDDHYPIGKMSKQYLEKLILNKYIRVDYTKRGYYGRIIGTIYLNKTEINLKIIQAGYSALYLKNAPHRYLSDYYIAKLKGRGIFKAKSFKMPWTYRKAKKKGLL